MARSKVKIDIRDPRAAFCIGALLGMVLVTAPQMIAGLIMLTGLVVTIKLVEMGRL